MVRSLQREVLPIASEPDRQLVRALVRARATAWRFSAVALTMIVTAASELGRNTLLHGAGGTMAIETVLDGERSGLRLTFEDRGPGIADLALAMTDGYTTKRGMGLGLSGSKRLVHEFLVEARDGGGTRVTVLKWA